MPRKVAGAGLRRRAFSRPQKTPRQKIIDRLDALVSKIIRERDGRCMVCGTDRNLTNGHIFSRQSYSLRWDLREDGNCHCQCKGCNLRHEYDPWPYLNWYIGRFSAERLDVLHAEHRSVTKWSTNDLELFYQDMKARYDDGFYSPEAPEGPRETRRAQYPVGQHP